MGNCYNTLETNVPKNEVWDTICDFHDLSWAPGVVTSMKIIGNKKGNEVGAKRILNNAFHETLIKLDPDNYTFSYSIDDGPGPVAKGAVRNYVGVVKLSNCAAGTLVEWSSSFKSANDQAVADFCNPIYQALLQALNESLT